jgi:hypothetical protein
MNRSTRLAVLFLLLVAHSLMTLPGMMEVGLIGLFQRALADWPARQVFSDLSVSLVLIAGWMLHDAKQRGTTAWPFVIALLPLGSFAALGYLIVRELGGAPSLDASKSPART